MPTFCFVHRVDAKAVGFRNGTLVPTFLYRVKKYIAKFFFQFFFKYFLGDLFSFVQYNIQHCFICRPSDFTVSTDAGIEPRTVATSALAVRRSNH